ncbi:MAG: LptF/LptG family permease [Phycisphaeraceae bacterium]|nr:LptF/LptG family permease [Phycisphaeraceae bacterium]
MPWTIYRYILREMLKLLILSSGVLVTVISVAAAVRPLSEGLIGPLSLIKFVSYTAPTMLTFALPFAGAFAATLVFLRMAGDNEITACSASGISYAGILLPVLALGLVLTMGLFYASNFVMPWFYREASRTVQTDLITALVAQLDKRQPYVLGRDKVVIYADRAEQHEVTPELAEKVGSDIPPSKLIVLQGVAVGELDDEGRMRSDGTGRKALLLVFNDPDSDTYWVRIQPEQAMYFDAASGRLGYIEKYTRTIEIPSPFRDHVEFLDLRRLRQLRVEPDGFDEVRRQTRELIDAMTQERLLEAVIQGLRQGPQRVVALKSPLTDERFLIRAPHVRRMENELLLTGEGDRRVTIEQESAGQVKRRYEAVQAVMRINEDSQSEEPTLLVKLSEVRVWDVRSADMAAEHATYNTLPAMTWPTKMLGKPRDEILSDEILAEAQQPRYQQGGNRGRTVIAAARRLKSTRDELAKRISAQLHSRAASAVACTLLLLLGAVLSMKMKQQMPLVVYFWSFMLAIVTLVIIYTGNNLVQSEDLPLAACLGVLWLGNVLRAVVTGTVYCRLARN